MSAIPPQGPGAEPFDPGEGEPVPSPPADKLTTDVTAVFRVPTSLGPLLREAIAARPVARVNPVPVSSPSQALSQMRLIRDVLTAEPPPRNNLGALATVYAETLDAFIEEARGYQQAGAAGRARAFEQVMVGLANRHFEALAAFERGDMSQVPEPYRVAFAKAVEVPPASLGAVLAAANWAHVWYDLPVTLRDLAAKKCPGFDLSSGKDRTAFVATNAALAGVEKRWIAGLERAYPGNTFTPQLKVLGSLPGIDIGGHVGWTREKAWDLAARPDVTDEKLSSAIVGLSRASIAAVAVGDAIFSAAQKVEAAGEKIYEAAHEVGRAAKSAFHELVSTVRGG